MNTGPRSTIIPVDRTSCNLSEPPRVGRGEKSTVGKNPCKPCQRGESEHKNFGVLSSVGVGHSLVLLLTWKKKELVENALLWQAPTVCKENIVRLE